MGTDTSSPTLVNICSSPQALQYPDPWWTLQPYSATAGNRSFTRSGASSHGALVHRKLTGNFLRFGQSAQTSLNFTLSLRA